MRALGRRKYPRMVTDEDVHFLNNPHTYAILTTYEPVSTCRLHFIVRWSVGIEENKDLPLEIRKSAYSDLLKRHGLRLEHLVELKSALLRNGEEEALDSVQTASQLVLKENLKGSFDGYRRSFHSFYLCELDSKHRRFLIVREPIITAWRSPGKPRPVAKSKKLGTHTSKKSFLPWQR